MSPQPSRLIVVGAGVVGQCAAFVLARAGWAVTILDPAPGRGASRAAAGMLAPGGEAAPGEEENHRLHRAALEAWGELVVDLESAFGSTVELHRAATLVVGLDAGDRGHVERYGEVARGYGVALRAVSRRDDPDPFEGLSTRVTGGLWVDGDAWVDPDQMLTVLEGANRALGVTYVADWVERVASDEHGVVAYVAERALRADRGVIATGSQGLPPGLEPRGHAVRPVRGMTVRVRGPVRDHLPMVRAYVHGRPVYAVGREHGYTVLGATSDEASAPVVELGELQRLLRDGLDLIPALEIAELLETRVGLRPASVDLRPFLADLGGGWLWSSGHYRHGVTLAPLAARRVRDVLGPA